MRPVSLYESAIRKQKSRKALDQKNIQSIKNLCNSTKISLKSSQILTNKLFSTIDTQNQTTVCLETSLPILYQANIIQVLRSVEQSKEITYETKQQYLRMREEAKFVYFLWKAIGKKEISTIQLIKFIYLFERKKGQELKEILEEIIDQPGLGKQLYDQWRNLQRTKLHYRQRRLKTHGNENKQNINNFCKMEQTNKQKNHPNCSHQNLSFETTIRSKKDQQTKVSIYQRLYNQNYYKDREQQNQKKREQEQKQELEECTFQPRLNTSRSRSKSREASVKGFNKAVDRMKKYQSVNMIDKKKYSQKYNEHKTSKNQPPSFNNRCRKPENIVLSITFEIGNKSVLLRIRERDTAESAAKKLGAIYGFNKESQEEVRQIIRKQMSKLQLNGNG